MTAFIDKRAAEPKRRTKAHRSSAVRHGREGALARGAGLSTIYAGAGDALKLCYRQESEEAYRVRCVV